MKHIKNHIMQDDVVWLHEIYKAGVHKRGEVVPVQHLRAHLLFPEVSGVGSFHEVMCNGGYSDIYRHLTIYDLGPLPACAVPVRPSKLGIIATISASGTTLSADPGDVIFLERGDVTMGFLRVEQGEVLVLFRRE